MSTKYTLRVIEKFSDEEKKRMVSQFLRRNEEDGIGLERYAALIGISRYTFRDWYRDPRYNEKWSELRGKKAGSEPQSDDDRYQSERAERIIADFQKRQESEGISLHEYAGLTGIPYYTLRYYWRRIREETKASEAPESTESVNHSESADPITP